MQNRTGKGWGRPEKYCSKRCYVKSGEKAKDDAAVEAAAKFWEKVLYNNGVLGFVSRTILFAIGWVIFVYIMMAIGKKFPYLGLLAKFFLILPTDKSPLIMCVLIGAIQNVVLQVTGIKKDSAIFWYAPPAILLLLFTVGIPFIQSRF